MADSSSLQSLLSTKAALDLGLISQADFDTVKASFLRAQQLKAAVDVGLIREGDYESAKAEYYGALIGGGAAGAGAAPAPPAPAAAAYRPAPPARPAAAPAANGGSSSGVAAATAMAGLSVHQQQPRPAPQPQPPAAAAPPPPPAAPRPAPTAAAPPPPQPRAPSGGGAANVPTNILKLGGQKIPVGGTSMSGVAVSEDAVNLFYHIRSRSAYQWALWRVDDSATHVVIAAVGEKGSPYQDFLDALPDTECRYGLFDFQLALPDGQMLNKLVFVNWAPENLPIKSKMVYSTTKDFFKGHLDGISKEFQASDKDEISEEEVAAAVGALAHS